MKKQTTRTVLIALVVLASLVSYIYLNTVEVKTVNTSDQYQLIESDEELQEEAAANTRLLLPDVEVIKKVIETGKSLIPGS